ncbi:NUDIX domain-containing protein [Streptomyces sp. CA-294286]|uniref:NUDIX domain-containing protein n=1 Tax=Streptomyces sp. CA-294286 TaxID=3240070 RepID=UPI003D90903F
MPHTDTDYTRPGHRRIGCLALIRNPAGDVLIVHPTNKEGAQLVGGGAKPNEAPHHAAYREAVEETGLTSLVIGDLLVVDYIPAANAETGSVEGYNLVFDAGVIEHNTQITLPPAEEGREPELSGWTFCPPFTLDGFCAPYQARRIREALNALADPSRRGLRIEGLPA